MSEPIRVLLIDDHPAWGNFLRHSLHKTSGFAVLDCVGSTREALRVVKNVSLDMVVVNVKLSNGCGLDMCQKLQQMKVPTPSLILTSYNVDIYLAQALAAGAVGYLLKNDELETITDAICRAAQGEILWTHNQLLRARRWQQVVGNQWGILTEREREVVAALVHFKGNNEIAEELNISPHTVHHHLSRIFKKLRMADRAEVARWAVENKLVGW